MPGQSTEQQLSLFSDVELSGLESGTIPLCGKCGLYMDCQSPKMEVSGGGRKGILIVGEAPGRHEDEDGLQFVGKSGNLLKYQFKRCGIDMRRDCWITNSLICRPGANDTPTDRQIGYCRPNLLNTIRDLNPRIIILAGGSAVRSLIGHVLGGKTGAVTGWVGWTIPDQKFNAWICPVYHPAYLARQHSKALDTIALGHIHQAVHCRGRPWRKVPDYAAHVECLTDPERAAKVIRRISQRGGYAAWDLETNMLKPDGDGARILSASICWEGKKTISFPWKEPAVSAFVGFLKSSVRKIAHNMKFDHRWVMKLVDTRTQNWYWDTILMAHILDPRQGICSLNFQMYVHLGLAPYDQHVDGLKRSDGPCVANRLHECDLHELLQYGGMDALATYKLFERQKKHLAGMSTENSSKLARAYELMHEGILALADVEQDGVHIDTKYLQSAATKVRATMSSNESRIEQTETYRVWKETYDGQMNLNSGVQLGNVLFDVMGVECPARTNTGRPKTDKETLRKVGGDFVDLYLGNKQLDKSLDYFKGWSREVVEGFIHPVYNLHMVKTYRSSCADPNFMNVPSRDPVMSRMAREAFIPRPGHVFIEADFAALEWSIAAAFWRDSRMLADASSTSLDIHRDMAARCYMMNKSQVVGAARYCGKNGFTFPYLYGSDYLNISKNMWDMIGDQKLEVDGVPMADHLASKGITELGAQDRELQPLSGTFESHIFEVQQWFDAHFSQLCDRKAQWIADYDRRGWFPLMTGFICRGEYSRNQLLNLPVQGPAFHILLWALVQLVTRLRARGMRSVVVGEVHDSMLLDVAEDEVEEVLAMMKSIMTDEVRKVMPWIIVPLQIEIKMSRSNWFEMEVLK